MHWPRVKPLRSSGVLLLLLLIGDLVVAQVTEISKEEFSRKYFAAIEKAQALARRETAKTERFQDDELAAKEEWILEYDLEYRSRLIYSRQAPKVSRAEMIVSGEKIFCRTEAGPWKLVESLCLVGPVPNQVVGIVSSRYSVQRAMLDNKRVRIYQEYVTYKNPMNRGDGRLRFMETKFWLDENGQILKRHTRNGLVGTDKISFEDVYAFEYDPRGLKIEVPIP